MSTKAMKRLGIAFLVTGIASYGLAFFAWTSIALSMVFENINSTPIFVIIFAIGCFFSTFAYGAIPLLIMSHIRNKRETQQHNYKKMLFCPYCGTPREVNGRFCKKCGNKFI